MAQSKDQQMWVIERFETRTATLDFSSSGLGRRDVMQLVADDTVFANAADLTDWSEDPFQVEVCEACGFVHCEPGGWLSARRAGDVVIFAPAFTAILNDDPRSNEYEPPRFTRRARRGVPLMPPDVYERLRAIVGLPLVSELPPLSGFDAAYLAQWEAPFDMLGRCYEAVEFREGVAVASSEETPEYWASELSGLVAQTQQAASVSVVKAESSPVVLYLDLPGLPEWPVVVRVGNRWAWYVEPTLALLPASPREPV